MATLSRADVEHVAHLARLGLTDDELDEARGRSSTTSSTSTRSWPTVPTDHIAPTAQTIELENILRDDVVRPSLRSRQCSPMRPRREGDFIVVPAILDERLTAMTRARPLHAHEMAAPPAARATSRRTT